MILTLIAISVPLVLTLKSAQWNRTERQSNSRSGTQQVKNVSGQSPAATTEELMASLSPMMSLTKRASTTSSNGSMKSTVTLVRM
ncbi:hypothetical protein HID58_006917 [Brassica napus]|uniref:Uncharacterized protein n=1 Tax=Brassica napus TaxID=3708 RepID=A0ABQ8EFP4_BRANA|nr:hypothetical protein HID58_006917 [Brassica napus]